MPPVGWESNGRTPLCCTRPGLARQPMLSSRPSLTNATDGNGIRWADVERLKRSSIAKDVDGSPEAFDKASALAGTLLQQKNAKINLEPRMGSKAVPKNVMESAIASLTQFPVLALMNIRRMAMVGGVAGAAHYMMYLIMGDTMYEYIKEMTLKDKSPEEIMEQWEEDPYGETLKVFSKATIAGGPIGQGIKMLMAQAGAQFVNMIDEDYAKDS